MRIALITMTLVAASLGGGCGSESSAAQPAPENADGVFKAWSAAGLEVSEHALLPRHTLGEARCMRGEVAKVETTVCMYDSPEAATKARDAGLKIVGQHTGASLARGPLLLVVADRRDADKDGKAINTLTKTFLGR